MTTTGANTTATAGTSKFSWWPDRRPVRSWEAPTWFGFGIFWLAMGLFSLAMADSFGTDLTTGFFQLVLGAFWLSQAGLLSSRPGPERRQVLVYRAAWYASGIPVLVAAYALWFL